MTVTRFILPFLYLVRHSVVVRGEGVEPPMLTQFRPVRPPNYPPPTGESARGWNRTNFSWASTRRLHATSAARARESRTWESNPALDASKASRTPTRSVLDEVGVRGFEPPVSWTQTRRDSQTTPHPEKILFSDAIKPEAPRLFLLFAPVGARRWHLRAS